MMGLQCGERSLTSCAGGRHNMPPSPASWPLTFLTLKVVPESRVTWPTSVPILVFLGLSVLDLGPTYATDVRRASSLNAPSTQLNSNLFVRNTIVQNYKQWRQRVSNIGETTFPSPLLPSPRLPSHPFPSPPHLTPFPSLPTSSLRSRTP